MPTCPKSFHVCLYKKIKCKYLGQFSDWLRGSPWEYVQIEYLFIFTLTGVAHHIPIILGLINVTPWIISGRGSDQNY